jgi:tetratricopeptide (TPR) repeat protein
MKIVKVALPVFLITISVHAHGQQIDYSAWQEEAKTNIRLLPEYGNAEKTKEQKEADEEFIKTSLKQDGTRERASEHMIELGFNYLSRNDLKTAMYRFNQAWLLNPKNENAYWGFGVIYFSFNDLDKAMAQYEKGLKINPRSSNLLTGKASVMMSRFQASGSRDHLTTAINILKQSYAIDPKNQITLYRLSACYLLSADCKNALKYYEECMALGGKPVVPEYTKAIKKECGE